MLRTTPFIVTGLLLTAASAPVIGAQRPATKPSPKATAASSVQREIDGSVRKGLAYLRKKQEADGSWQRYPGTTAICLMGLLRSGATMRDPAVAKAAAYLAALAKPNGAIYTDQYGPAQMLPNYNTALAMTALHLTGEPKYREIVKKAQTFLAQSQFDEGEGFTPKDPQYGGIGYGSRVDNPDVSNLQNALEALKETGYPSNSEVFRKAITFLQRCQNRSESNDQAWAGNDGGFVYASSGESKADEITKVPHSSYGSMTYAGLKSYIYANVSRSDPRVQAAWNWLRANYDVNQNPGMRDAGLYYYYHTMSKTLDVWGQKVVTDSKGGKHPWGTELARAIIRRQKADGSWANSNPRWWEDRSELVTGYSLMSLANCKRGL